MTHPEQVVPHCEHDMLQKANVIGVGADDEKVIVFVEKKVPEDELSEYDLVPHSVEDVPTDVVEVGHITPMLAPGTSIGLADRSGGTGTAGCVVMDAGIGGRYYILTNNHVAANSNLAPLMSSIASPGPADNLGPVIGRLVKAEAIRFDRPNYIDAALVEVPREIAVKGQYAFGYRILTPRPGWRVKKTGRTTGLTSSKVIATRVTIRVDFGNQGVAEFRNQIATGHMLDPGDSGSVLATPNGHACGLGFAGSDKASFHNVLSDVFEALGVRMPRSWW